MNKNIFFVCALYKVKTCCGCHGKLPAVVTADAPDADACDWLGVENAAVHGVDQVQHVVLQ